MKSMKMWFIVAGLIWVTALMGHFLGKWRGEREVLAEWSREEAARTAKQRAIGESIARHVRASDEIVLVNSEAKPELKQVQSFQDDAWRTKLADLLVTAPCEPIPMALWATASHVEFKTKGITTLTCMWAGRVLRVHGKDISGDFIVGDAVIAELAAWVQGKQLATEA